MLLFLDVDGTLIPFGASQPHREYRCARKGADASSQPLLTRVKPENEIGPAELDWTAEHYRARALLYPVGHRTGLSAADIDAIRTWVGGD